MPVLVPLRRGNRGKIYFVDPTNGSDNADGGSAGRAWQTLAKVNAAILNPFDRVLGLGGATAKTQQLVVPASGVAGGEIYFGVYGSPSQHFTVDPTARYTDFALDSGAIWKRTDAAHNIKQVFQDGVRMIYASTHTGLVAGAFAYESGVVYVRCSDDGNPNSGHVIEYCTSDIDAVIKFNGKSNLRFEGIDVTKGNTTAYNTDLAGSSNIALRNFITSFMGTRAVLLGTNTDGTTEACSDILVSNAISHDDLDVGFWMGRGTRFITQYCEAYNEGMDVGAASAKKYPTTGAQQHFPDAILLSGGAVDCVIRGCNVHDMYIGSGIADETSPTASDHGTNSLIEKNLIDCSVGTALDGIKICGISTTARNNKIYQPATTGNGINLTNTPSNAAIYHNTIVGVSGATHSVLVQSGTGLAFKNNIVVRAGTTNRYISHFAAATGSVIDYNEYYGAGTFRCLWGPAGEYTSFANWQGDAHAPDAHSLNSDPVFVTPNTDLHLQTTSPCKNAGATGLGVMEDFDGKVRDASPDMGCYEYA